MSWQVRDEIQSFEALISLATRLDNRMRKRCREKTHHPLSQNTSLQSQPPFQTTSGIPLQYTFFPQVSTHCHLRGAYATWLTPSERQRRLREGLCIYCGQAAAKSLGSPEAVLVSQTQSSTLTPRPRTQLKAVLMWEQSSFPFTALIDSGADDNFIDATFAAQSNPPIQELPVSQTVRALDGRLLSLPILLHPLPFFSQETIASASGCF